MIYPPVGVEMEFEEFRENIHDRNVGIFAVVIPS